MDDQKAALTELRKKRALILRQITVLEGALKRADEALQAISELESARAAGSLSGTYSSPALDGYRETLIKRSDGIVTSMQKLHEKLTNL
jgi:hypothetical protein